MPIIRERYKTIKDFINGLHTAGLLENKLSGLIFLNEEKFWSSQLTIREKGNIDLFSVRYYKEVDEVWVVSNINAASRNEIAMITNNILGDVKKVYNLTSGETSIRNTYSCMKAFLSLKIEHHHDYIIIYELYKMFRAYQTGEKYTLKEISDLQNYG
ncbi:hypothetical protein D3C81_1253020 [compost metagenome]